MWRGLAGHGLAGLGVRVRKGNIRRDEMDQIRLH